MRFLMALVCAVGFFGSFLHAASSAKNIKRVSKRSGAKPAKLAIPTGPVAPSASVGGDSDPKLRGFLHSWSEMAKGSEEEQPNWLSPMVTTSGRLKDELRFDAWRPISPSGEPYYSLGGGKGLEFIIHPRVQLLIGVPTVVEYPHSPSRTGVGDMPLMAKIRIASAPRGEGDYLVTFLLKATTPTGSKNVSLHHAVLTPEIAAGKGWKQFDVQTTAGPSFPTGSTFAIGRQLSWDTAFQYRAAHKLWPELEVNTIHYLAGKYMGENQAFLTPGLGFGRVRLGGPVSFSAGAAFQIAVTEFHTYNHQLVLSVRFPF
jgi:hypothetical protein